MPKQRTKSADILVVIFILSIHIKGTGSSANRKSEIITKADNAYEETRAPGRQKPPLIVWSQINSTGWQRRRLYKKITAEYIITIIIEI